MVQRQCIVDQFEALGPLEGEAAGVTKVLQLLQPPQPSSGHVGRAVWAGQVSADGRLVGRDSEQTL